MNELLRFQGIGKRFQKVQAIHKVSLAVRAGAVLGIVGENGAGKSTLMNVLGGVVQPDAGQMMLDGNPFAPGSPADAAAAGIAFIHQELNLFPNLSIIDNLFIDRFPRRPWSPFIRYRSARQQCVEVLHRVRVSAQPETLVEQLSPGERQLVEIARALSTDARLIIFDEPTTSLTAREAEQLFGLIRRLRKAGKAILYISHQLEDVMALSDEIVVLRDGEVVAHDQAEAFTVDRLITAMVGRDLHHLYPKREDVRAGDPILEVEAVSLSGIVHDITFTLCRREVLGVFGLMGSGRTELAHVLFGLETAESGDIRLDGITCRSLPPGERIARGMAFVTEDRRGEGLLVDGTTFENMSLAALKRYARAALGALDRNSMLEDAQALAAQLHIKSGHIHREPVKVLSGGNQQKAVIGKWLMTQPSVFILDEPTRGIDVGAKYEVYTIMRDLAGKGAGILVISSELEELIGIADRILVMRQGEITGRFEEKPFDREGILRAAFGEEVQA